jgi:uncharacterized protein (AIM24 family)
LPRLRYQIDHWKKGRKIRLGDSNRPGRWLELDLARNERVRSVEGQYTVYFRGPEGKTFRWQTRDEEAWRGIREGGRYRVEAYTGSGKVVKILRAAP